MTARVTAVIPSYNYARFVGRAIDSVLRQTYPSLDLIVVDDGSSDETREVIAPYGDKLTYIRKPKNAGLAAARNTGIERSRGDYIAFLDADDLWHPDKIRTQVELYEQRPELGAVGCGLKTVDDSGMLMKSQAGLPVPTDPIKRVRAIALRKSWVGGSGSGALIHRRVFEDIGGFDESLAAAEDWDMWLRIAEKYPIDNVADVLVTLTIHGTGVFRNVRRFEVNQTAVLSKLLTRSPDICDSLTLRRVRSMIQLDGAGEAYGKDWSVAARYAARSVSIWPLDLRGWRMLGSAVARLGVSHGR